MDSLNQDAIIALARECLQQADVSQEARVKLPVACQIGSPQQLDVALCERALAGIGGRTWPCAHVLIEKLDDLVNVSGKVVLDIGCGTGVVGFGAWTKGAARALLSDVPSLESLVEDNIARVTEAASNQLNTDTRPSGDLAFVPFDWQEEPPLELTSQPLDLVLGADVTYGQFSSNLVDVLTKLPVDKAILIHPCRSDIDVGAEFIGLAQERGWAVESTPVGETMAHGNDTEERATFDVLIFTLSRHSK